MRLPSLDLSLQKKTCKQAFFGRVWSSGRRALNLDHAPAHHFGCSQWQTEPRPATAYLIYRWLLFLLVLFVAIASFACQRLPKKILDPTIQLNYFKWFIYFTNWGLLLIVVQSGLALAVAIRYRIEKNIDLSEDEGSPMPRRRRAPALCHAYRLAHIIATDFAFVITLTYWTLVHDPKIHEVNALNLLVHGGNSIVMLVELAVTAHPVHAAHALYSAGAGLAYSVFSVIYWAFGGTDRVGDPAIYPTLNWNLPATSLTFSSICAIVMVSVHIMATGLTLLRSRVAARLLPARTIQRLTLPTH